MYNMWQTNGCDRSLEKIPRIANLKKFINDWRTWYLSLQPKFRHHATDGGVTWPYPCSTSHNGEEFEKLRKYSWSGFVQILILLGWWQTHTLDEEEFQQWSIAAGDVAWVLKEMVRTSENEEDDNDNGKEKDEGNGNGNGNGNDKNEDGDDREEPLRKW